MAIPLLRETYMHLVRDVDAQVKRTNGHQFITILKTRCQRCGRSPKARGKCPFWFDTFIDLLGTKLIELEHGTPKPPATAKL